MRSAAQLVDDVLATNISVVRADSCSASQPDTVMRAFERACDASLHPIGPLYNHVQKRLRCRAIRAFSRIFDLADRDGDGALSDSELKRFHLFAFGRPLDDQELHSTLQVRPRAGCRQRREASAVVRRAETQPCVQALIQRDTESVTTAGVTRAGFMHLQALIIVQERLDVCWHQLRKFGYDKTVALDPALLSAVPGRVAADPAASSLPCAFDTVRPALGPRPATGPGGRS